MKVKLVNNNKKRNNHGSKMIGKIKLNYKQYIIVSDKKMQEFFRKANKHCYEKSRIYKYEIIEDDDKSLLKKDDKKPEKKEEKKSNAVTTDTLNLNKKPEDKKTDSGNNKKK